VRRDVPDDGVGRRHRGAERDVIRGALREIDARIRSAHIEAMLAQAAKALENGGRDARIRAVAAALAGDTVRAETAFTLAAAVAFADDKIVQDEQKVLNLLAATRGIEHRRAAELFDSLEKVDDVLGADPKVDAADLLLVTTMRLNAPEDFERLVAMSPRADVQLLMRLYASFVRSGDQMRERPGTTPRSLSAARVAALRDFATGLASARLRLGHPAILGNRRRPPLRCCTK